jgi:hypothetical protein
MHYPFFDSEFVLARLKPESLNEHFFNDVRLGIQVQWFAVTDGHLIDCKPDYSTLSLWPLHLLKGKD